MAPLFAYGIAHTSKALDGVSFETVNLSLCTDHYAPAHANLFQLTPPTRTRTTGLGLANASKRDTIRFGQR